MIYKVLDTNIPLMDATNLLNIGREPGVTVVLPETVLAELDAKKSGFEEVNWQARATARLLANGTVLSMTTTDFGTISSMDIQGAKLELVSLNNYTDSSSEYGGNDRRIIQTAKVLTETRPDDEVIIISSDFYVRWQALCVGVRAEDLKIVVRRYNNHFIIRSSSVSTLAV
jgi:PhoH-like ATPase